MLRAVALGLLAMAHAEGSGFVLLQCDVWGAGGPDGFHSMGTVQGGGGSRDEAQAAAEREMRQTFGSGPRLGHCVTLYS